MEIVLTQQNNASASPNKGQASTGTDEARELADAILNILDENSAQEIIDIDIKGKSSVADVMIVASGRSNRHVGALADYVLRDLKERGHKSLGIEGQIGNDWVLIDAGDVIVHIFRPEVRAFYNLEKIWSVPVTSSEEE